MHKKTLSVKEYFEQIVQENQPYGYGKYVDGWVQKCNICGTVDISLKHLGLQRIRTDGVQSKGRVLLLLMG